MAEQATYHVVLGLYYVRLYFGRSGSGEIRGEGARGIKYGVLGLDLDELGDRTVKCFFTYPLDWRAYCRTDRVWDWQWKAFLNKWRERWGEPVGYWVKEFQERAGQAPQYQGAPHMNWVAKWPEGAKGYGQLLARTLRIARAESRGDVYGARATRELMRGEFGWWLRTAWAEVVTGNDGSEEAKKHQARGVECRVNYWSEKQAEMADRAQVAWYVARDVGKERQKTAPQGFGRVRPWWGAQNMRWEDPLVLEVPYLVYVRLWERLAKWCEERGVPVPDRGPVFGGITAPMMRGEEGALLLAVVESELAGDVEAGTWALGQHPGEVVGSEVVALSPADSAGSPTLFGPGAAVGEGNFAWEGVI